MPKLSYRKPSNKSGEQYSITLPKDFIIKMGINPDDRNVEVSFNEKTKIISIKKKVSKEVK